MLEIWLFFALIFFNPPRTALPVPNTLPQIQLSGPLVLQQIETSVLGAQAIDPIDFVNEINKQRQKIGAPILRLNKVLMDAAKMRVSVIKKYQNFSHQDPYEGIELGTVLPKLNYHFQYATENIGMGGISASDFVNGFMNSTAHKNNLLDPRLTDTGAAIADGPYKQYYVNYAVQLFTIPDGRDEYLGYSQKDRKIYEQSLTSVSLSIHPIRLFVLKIFKKYDAKNVSSLTQQKNILQSLVKKMQNNQPLENHDVALILNYNALL